MYLNHFLSPERTSDLPKDAQPVQGRAEVAQPSLPTGWNSPAISYPSAWAEELVSGTPVGHFRLWRLSLWPPKQLLLM